MNLGARNASSSVLTAVDSPSPLLRGEGRGEESFLSSWSRYADTGSFKLCANRAVKWPPLPSPLLQWRRGNEPTQVERASRLRCASGATKSEKGGCP